MLQNSDPIAQEALLPASALTFEEIIAATLMALIVGAVSWGVFTRYVLGAPADWAPEVAAIAFAWVVFLAAAPAFLRGDHSAVDALVVKLPKRLRKVTQLLADAIVLATLVITAWLAMGMAFSTRDVPTTVLQVPQSITYSAAALGFALMAIRHLTFVIRRLRRDGSAA